VPRWLDYISSKFQQDDHKNGEPQYRREERTEYRSKLAKNRLAELEARRRKGRKVTFIIFLVRLLLGLSIREVSCTICMYIM
jgi:hypothetical protein